MKIKHIQKLTLIDFPGKLACIIFLYGCNFKCGFCHNPELVLEDKLPDISEDEIFEFLEKRKRYLEGVCITGGEPLLNLDKEFLKKIKSIGYEVKIDTNGFFPEKLDEVVKGGLVDYIAIDIKSSKEKYSEVCGVEVDLGKIEESIKLISNFDCQEFRTTVVEEVNTKQDVEEMLKWLNLIVGGKVKKMVFQGFKNQGKFINGALKDKKDTSEEYLEELKALAESYCEVVEVRV